MHVLVVEICPVRLYNVRIVCLCVIIGLVAFHTSHFFT